MPSNKQVVRDLNVEECAEWMYQAMTVDRPENEQLGLMRSILHDGVLEVCVFVCVCVCVYKMHHMLAENAQLGVMRSILRDGVF